MDNKPFKEYDFQKDAFGEPQCYSGVNFYPLPISEYDVVQQCGIFYYNNKIDRIPFFARVNLFKYLLLYNSMVDNSEIIDTLKRILETVFKQKIEFKFKQHFRLKEYEPYEKNFTKYLFMVEDMDEASKVVDDLRFYIYLTEDKKFFSDARFKVIKDIIIYQNGLPLDNFKASSEIVHEQLEKSRQYIMNKIKMKTFFEDVVLYQLLTKKTDEETKKTTYKKFNATVTRFSRMLRWLALKPLEVSGQIKWKDKGYSLEEWDSHIKEYGYYENVMEDSKSYLDRMSKIQGGNKIGR